MTSSDVELPVDTGLDITAYLKPAEHYYKQAQVVREEKQKALMKAKYKDELVEIANKLHNQVELASKRGEVLLDTWDLRDIFEERPGFPYAVCSTSHIDSKEECLQFLAGLRKQGFYYKFLGINVEYRYGPIPFKLTQLSWSG
jgi:hypothetical protein